MLRPPVPRYDRIVSLVLVVLLGLAVTFLIDVNPNIIRARLGGDLPTLTVSWLLIATLVIVTSTGADLLARSHPQMQSRTLPQLRLGPLQIELVPSFWILPAFSVISSFAFFRLFGESLQSTATVMALLAAGGLLLITLIAQHYALDRQPDVYQPARLVLQAIAYLLLFGVACAVSFAGLRTLYSAPLIAATVTLLAYVLLQWTSGARTSLYAVLVGLLIAEAVWAINYWPISFLIEGAVLLVLFHVLTGVLLHHASGTLNRRLISEYAGFGLLMLVILLLARGFVAT